MAGSTRQLRNFVSSLTEYSSFHRYDPIGILLLLPVVLLFTFITVIPVLYGIWLSFHSGVGAVDLEWVGLANYSMLLGSDEFWNSLVTGMIYAVYSVAAQVVTGTVIALALNNLNRFGSIIRSIVFVPYMIPTVAVAVIFKLVLNNEIGFLNYYLLQLGVIDQGVNFWSFQLAIHSVVWASVWKWNIFVVILVLARLQSIDRQLYELARINGANLVQRFFDVTYPNIRSVLFLIVLLRGIWMFNKFDMIWLLTNGGPLDATTTMVVLAFQRGFREFNFGAASAVTTSMFLILVVFGLVYFMAFSPEEEVEVSQ